jgi:hypothetical protein
VVTHIADKTIHARVDVGAGERLEGLDARPSDAVNLALRTGAPILAAVDLLREQPAPPGREVELVDEDAGRVVARIIADRPIEPGWITAVQGGLGPPDRWQVVRVEEVAGGRAVVRRLES